MNDLFKMSFKLYRLTWKTSDVENVAEFWLEAKANPDKEVGSLLNLVELDASENGYAYELEVIGGFRNA
jgi:hypothetical protein